VWLKWNTSLQGKKIKEKQIQSKEKLKRAWKREEKKIACDRKKACFPYGNSITLVEWGGTRYLS
jgi:hypothetical protein